VLEVGLVNWWLKLTELGVTVLDLRLDSLSLHLSLKTASLGFCVHFEEAGLNNSVFQSTCH